MCSLKQSPCDHYFTFTLFLLLHLLRASFYIVCYSLYYLPLMFPNAVKNSVTFYKSSKLLFFEKIVIKYPEVNHTFQNMGMSVSMLLKTC